MNIRLIEFLHSVYPELPIDVSYMRGYSDEVLSIQPMSVENEKLSHVQQKENDNFKSITLEYHTDEDREQFYSYNFYSAGKKVHY